MKTRLILSTSLVLNLGLAVALIVRRQVQIPPASLISPRPGQTALSASPASLIFPAPVEVPPAPATNSAFNWSAIESDDYHQYVSNLQAFGCPPRTIRDLIVADIDELYATKLAQPATNPPPWLNADHRGAEERGRAAHAAALKAEKRALVKELIGYEWDNHANEVWHEDFMASLAFGFLPDDKPPQLIAILKKYEDLSGSVKTAANGILIYEDRAALKQLHDALLAEVSQLLSPAEWEEVQLRGQAEYFLATQNIGWDGFSLTGAELREFIRLSQSFDDPLENEFLGRPEPSEKEKSARKAAFEGKVAQLFGPVRFAEYQRAQDAGFREGWAFAKDRNLTTTKALRIFAARRAAEDQALEINRDSSLDGEQKALALANLKSSATTTLSDELGDSFGDYLSGPGQWLESLAAFSSKSEEAGQ